MIDTMKLTDTAAMMASDDYKERFAAEYFQLKIRCKKLSDMIASYKDGTLPFAPSCSIDLLEKQREYMVLYLGCLATRAEIEGVELEV